MLKLIVLAILSTPIMAINNCINPNYITFTFDDGPHVNTPAIVKVLDKYLISGTFFITGLNIIRDDSYTALIKSMSVNHIIASHGFSHASMSKLNNFNQLRELYDNELVFRKILNKRPAYYRPPYFDYDANINNIANSFGYTIITSDLNTDDWNASSSDEIYNNFLTKLDNNGTIMLMHDYQILNLNALERIIQYLQKNNYSIVSLNKCIGVDKQFNDDNTYSPNLLNGVSA